MVWASGQLIFISTDLLIDWRGRLGVMKATKPKEPVTGEEQQRFEKFGRALMAVPKKELDKELAKSAKAKTHKPLRAGRRGRTG